MKKIFFTYVFIGILFTSYSQNFKAKITYEATLNNSDYYNRLINDTSITEFSRNAKLENIKSTSPMNFILLINGNEALYKSEYSLIEQKNKGWGYNRTGSVARDDNSYYTNLDINEQYYQSFFTQEVLVNADKINWILTKETKNIGEYTCYKAIATIETEQLIGMNFLSPIIAWYTPDIPTPFGIQNFRGLPGLTIELMADYEDGKVTYKLVDVDWDPENLIIVKPKAPKQMTEKEYVEYIKKMNANRF